MDIIGAGRIGQALHDAATARGLDSHLVSRTDGWDALATRPAGVPLLIATRNDDLADVVARVPAFRRDDLVFVQNGMIRPFLADQGLAAATRGILFFAVQARGDAPVPGDVSPFHGPRAQAVVDHFAGLGLPAEVASSGAFKAVEIEKLAWNCAFGLLSEVLAAPVGELADVHTQATSALLAELLRAGGSAVDVELDVPAAVERSLAYSRSIPDYRGAVKEWGWRNGWFAGLAQRGADLPRHAEWLAKRGLGA